MILMRITGGSKRGYKFKINIDGSGVRPARDFVRQAIFNIIREEVEGATVIDLFAGTGLVGMEALSRGARYCLFVENNPRAIKMIVANLEKAQLTECSRLLKYNANMIARFLASDDKLYNLIFIDPPYAISDMLSLDEGVGKIFFDLVASDRISSGALFIMEQRKRAGDLPAIEGLVCEDKRIYGDSKVSFFRKK
jgi:16S rRNA (guanine(966)-N(2))-methyltransferase RsmD